MIGFAMQHRRALIPASIKLGIRKLIIHWITVRRHQIALHNHYFHTQQHFLEKNCLSHFFYEKKLIRFLKKPKAKKRITSLLGLFIIHTFGCGFQLPRME